MVVRVRVKDLGGTAVVAIARAVQPELGAIEVWVRNCIEGKCSNAEAELKDEEHSYGGWSAPSTGNPLEHSDSTGVVITTRGRNR